MSEATPKDMPGAGAETEPSAPAETATTPAVEVAKSEAQPKPTETVDFWKSKAREQEQRAKSNFEDAQRWREIKAGKDDFDPREEITKLTERLESSERARVRADVARTTGVDPEDIKGDTEDEMRESADRYKARFNARLEEALKSKTAPAAAPAAEVTSDKRVEGPKQLTQDDLKNMTSKQILDARKNGQLDDLIGNK